MIFMIDPPRSTYDEQSSVYIREPGKSMEIRVNGDQGEEPRLVTENTREELKALEYTQKGP
jgi:hypothetical protein